MSEEVEEQLKAMAGQLLTMAGSLVESNAEDGAEVVHHGGSWPLSIGEAALGTEGQGPKEVIDGNLVIGKGQKLENVEVHGTVVMLSNSLFENSKVVAKGENVSGIIVVGDKVTIANAWINGNKATGDGLWLAKNEKGETAGEVSAYGLAISGFSTHVKVDHGSLDLSFSYLAHQNTKMTFLSPKRNKCRAIVVAKDAFIEAKNSNIRGVDLIGLPSDSAVVENKGGAIGLRDSVVCGGLWGLDGYGDIYASGLTYAPILDETHLGPIRPTAVNSLSWTEIDFKDEQGKPVTYWDPFTNSRTELVG